MCNADSDEDSWADFETCPDGFCRHWSCNSDCELKCAQCGEPCPEHYDRDHPFVEPEAKE